MRHLLHIADHLLHHRAAAFCRLGRAARTVIGVTGAVSRLNNQRHHALYAANRGLELIGSLRRALRKIAVVLRHLAGCGGHGLHTALHLSHQRAQLLRHLRQRLHQLARFIAPQRRIGGGRVAQITRSNGLRQLHCLRQRRGDGANGGQRQQRTQQPHESAHTHRHALGHGALGLCLLLGLLALLLLRGNEGILRLHIAFGSRRQLVIHQFLRLPGLAQVARLIGLFVDGQHGLALFFHARQAALIDLALCTSQHLLLQPIGLLHQRPRFLRELGNQVLF